MKKGYFKRLLDAYLKKTAAPNNILDQYFEFSQKRQSFALPDDTRAERLLENIHLKIHAKQSKTTRLIWWYSGAAAAVLVLIGTLLLLQLNPNSQKPSGNLQVYSTANGEKKKLVLPDGSRVVLNAASQLTFAADFTQNRALSLNGEAYFEVVHDSNRPFIVHSKQMDIHVLGTVFNVRAYPNEPSQALLVRGSIQVFKPFSNEPLAMLKPSQRFTIGEGLQAVSQHQLIAKGDSFVVTEPKALASAERDSTKVAWINNQLSFENENFAVVTGLLERWYNIDIIIDNPKLLDYRFTGTYHNVGLTDVLESLRSSQEFNYRKEGNRVIIY